MEKLTTLCLITCALTTYTNTLCMLSRIMRQSTSHARTIYQPKPYIRTTWNDGPYHRNYLRPEGQSPKFLKQIIKQNKETTRKIREQNATLKALIDCNRNKLDFSDSLLSDSIDLEMRQLVQKFDCLEKEIRP